MLAHIAIAAVHFERPKAGFLALAIFASTTVVAYTALGMIDAPTAISTASILRTEWDPTDMADQDSDILERLMANNRTWAAEVDRDNPGFFERLSRQQTPRVLWIGCSDSRVPGNESIGVMPGEIFFHRNIANQMQMVDFNGLSVLQYAVDWLRVRHIIVCGHYGCGGVKTALKQNELGLLNNWLYGVGELSRRHKERLDALPDRNHRIDALCEFNVIEQVRNICRNPILLQAWRRGQDVSVHAWIYELTRGRLKDLGATVDGERYAEPTLDAAIARPPLAIRAG